MLLVPLLAMSLLGEWLPPLAIIGIAAILIGIVTINAIGSRPRAGNDSDDP